MPVCKANVEGSASSSPITIELPSFDPEQYSQSGLSSFSYKQAVSLFHYVSKYCFNFSLIADHFPDYSPDDLLQVFVSISTFLLTNYKSHYTSFKWLENICNSYDPTIAKHHTLLTDKLTMAIINQDAQQLDTIRTEYMVISNLHIINCSPQDYIALSSTGPLTLPPLHPLPPFSTSIPPPPEIPRVVLNYIGDAPSVVSPQEKEQPVPITGPYSSSLSKYGVIAKSETISFPQADAGMADHMDILNVLISEGLPIIEIFNDDVINQYLECYELAIKIAIQDKFNHALSERLLKLNSAKVKLRDKYSSLCEDTINVGKTRKTPSRTPSKKRRR
ncbi:hypothetical protein P9112_000303 [Eukaryota sp. TZLM1-RC]